MKKVWLMIIGSMHLMCFASDVPDVLKKNPSSLSRSSESGDERERVKIHREILWASALVIVGLEKAGYSGQSVVSWDIDVKQRKLTFMSIYLVNGDVRYEKYEHIFVCLTDLELEELKRTIQQIVEEHVDVYRTGNCSWEKWFSLCRNAEIPIDDQYSAWRWDNVLKFLQSIFVLHFLCEEIKIKKN
jgi:hypothetical protein